MLFEDNIMFDEIEILDLTDDAREEAHLECDNVSTLSPDLCPLDFHHPNPILVPQQKSFQEPILVK